MPPNRRFWQIDLLRGLALVLMIIFHIVVDLRDFFSWQISYTSGPWYYIGKLSAIMFIFIAGVSSLLSRNNLKRGVKILMWGMVLTLITYIIMPDTYIVFGILHLLGISSLSCQYAGRLSSATLLLYAAIFIAVGQLFPNIKLPLPYLLPLGLTTSTFTSIDYYPIFPWYGIFLLGIVCGRYALTMLPATAMPPYFSPLAFLGRHSLLIYLVHQPILLVVLAFLHTL